MAETLVSETRHAILRQAALWLLRAGKYPCPNDVGGFRWVLPDSIAEAGEPEMLPKEVFDRLYSFEAQPWNFPTVREALLAAIGATSGAIEAGEFHLGQGR